MFKVIIKKSIFYAQSISRQCYHYYLLIHDKRRLPCGPANNPEGSMSVSGRVSRVPRQSERRSAQIVFNRSTDGRAPRRGGYEIPQVRYYLASPWATTVAYRAIPFVAVRSASSANPLYTYILLGQNLKKKEMVSTSTMI